MSELTPVIDEKLHRLLPECDAKDDLEASGVLARDGHVLVIFDNTSRIARIVDPSSPVGNNEWVSDKVDGVTGYEDIAFSPSRQRYYLLIEAEKDDGTVQAAIVEYDLRLRQLERHTLPFPFEKENKGFEGLVCVQRDNRDYVLALCEGNECKGGEAGRTSGKGRIQIFRRDPDGWTHTGTLNLPPAADFVDYASLDIQEGRVVVLSQVSSRIWIGTLCATCWDFVDAGVVHSLPRLGRDPLYCNAEGIAWVSAQEIVVVSDKAKKDDLEHCEKKDQSIHRFTIPAFDGP